MSLHSRHQKIQRVANSSSTRKISQTSNHRSMWHVEGSEKPYQVQLTWNKQCSSIQAVLYSFSHKEKEKMDILNRLNTLTYHSLGAVKKAAQLQGKEIHFHSTLELAEKKKGKIISIVNLGAGKIYATFTDKVEEDITEQLEDYAAELEYESGRSFNNRVNLMRGPKEEGIY